MKGTLLERNALVGYSAAFGAALCYGGAQVLVKKGVADFTSPLVGSSVSLLAGMVIVALISIRSLDGPSMLSKKQAVLFMALAGMAASAGVTLSYLAISYAPVVIVAPVSGIHPLVSILCASIFLKQLEKITLKTILGACLIVIGIAIITVARML